MWHSGVATVGIGVALLSSSSRPKGAIHHHNHCTPPTPPPPSPSSTSQQEQKSGGASSVTLGGCSASRPADGLRVVLGATALPRNLVDTANLSILNAPVGKDGVVTEIVLRLGGVPPGDGEWDIRVFDLNPDTGGFALAALRSISVEPTAVAAKQHVQVHPPLAVREGQFVGICNPHGRIALTYRPGWVLPPRATEVGEDTEL